MGISKRLCILARALSLLCPQVLRQYSNIEEDATICPPWCLTVRLRAHTFEAEREHFIPQYVLDVPKVRGWWMDSDPTQVPQTLYVHLHKWRAAHRSHAFGREVAGKVAWKFCCLLLMYTVHPWVICFISLKRSSYRILHRFRMVLIETWNSIKNKQTNNFFFKLAL